MKAAPLAGTRVLDLSTMIAAPLAASLMSDWGASVIKIEQPGHGDHVRRFGAQSDGQGLYWKTLSRGKRTLAIDLHNPAGQDIVRKLFVQGQTLGLTVLLIPIEIEPGQPVENRA